MAETVVGAGADAAGLGGSILLRFAWRCGTLFTGAVALVMGVLYVKVRERTGVASAFRVIDHRSKENDVREESDARRADFLDRGRPDGKR